MRNKCYITQYGYWWSGDSDQVKQFLLRGSLGEFEDRPYNLDELFRPLSNRPKHIPKSFGDYTRNCRIYQPLDFNREDYKMELEWIM